MSEQPGPGPEGGGDLVDALLLASRALVAIAVRSLGAAGEEITTAQFRALVVLASGGPQRVADLAEALGVNASAATRMCDRLVAKRFVQRKRAGADRRVVRIEITPAGRGVVERVVGVRRRAVESVVDGMPAPSRTDLVRALQAFSAAAGEMSDREVSAAWDGGAPPYAAAVTSPG